MREVNAGPKSHNSTVLATDWSPMFWHLTARTLLGARPFQSPDVAWWFWRRMRETFPEAMAACLMPNHPHVVAGGDPWVLHRRMQRLMSGLARRLGERKLWETAPDPTPIRGPAHLERQVKYLHLNPCRAKLTSDPLTWPWSTHRGVIGAEADPWVVAARLAPQIHRPMDTFPRALHAYVCDDSTVGKNGRMFPRVVAPGVAASTPLPLIARAAASAAPWANDRERRDLALALARHQGWSQARVLAVAFGCSERTVFRARKVEAHALRASILALGDARLRLPDALIAPVALSRYRTRAHDSRAAPKSHLVNVAAQSAATTT